MKSVVVGSASVLTFLLTVVLADRVEAQTLGLAEAFDRAVSHAPSIQAAEHEITAQRQVEEQAQAKLYPNVSVDSTYSYAEYETLGSTVDPETLQRRRVTEEVDETTYSAGLNVTQPLYDRRKWKAMEQAGSQTETARRQFEAQRQQLATQLAETYLEVLRQRETLTLARAESEALALRVRQMEDQLERGLASRVDVLDAQVRKEEADSRIAEAQNALELAILDLQRLTGADVQRLQAAEPREMEVAETLDDSELRGYIERAAQDNPEVQIAGARLEAQRDQVEVRRSDHFPTLSLQARYSDTNRTDQVISGEDKRVMLQLQIPLYAGGGVSAGVDEAQARAQAEQARVDEARRRAALDVRQAANELRTAVRRLRVLSRSLDTAETHVEATERGLEVGLRDQVEVLDARARVFEIRRDLADAAYNRLVSLVRLRALTGSFDREQLREFDRRYLTNTVDLMEPGDLPEAAPAGGQDPSSLPESRG
ncbi:TolC family outer membrane protein [Arhodomonas sp. SL1]|uniref:TolC family outer membrane protein n=1 Tax=Arhodomonas sp. SL1 TaxID=3425691 RepID=UPI003F880AAD